MKELTKAEEQIMQVLWEIEQGFVKDIIELLPEPKPAYNTVSTIVRILEKKNFVSYKAYGKTHQYYPIVSKDEYKKAFFGNFLKNYFSNSFTQMVSFFTNTDNVDINDLEELKSIIDQEIKENKKNE